MAGRRIDVHHHMMPPLYVKEGRDQLIETASGFLSVLDWQAQESLDQLDQNGIDVAVMSIPTPGVWFGDAAQAVRLSRHCNEFGATLKRDHPGRFGLLAVLPLPDVEASLREIEYAFDTLGADGVGVLSSYEDIWLGDPRFEPVMAELNRRKTVVFVHPTTPKACRNLIPGVPRATLEFFFDAARALTNLLYSGSLSRHSDIKFLFTHSGGVMPLVAQRLGRRVLNEEPIKALVPEGPAAALGKVNFDCANQGTAVSMGAIRHIVADSQLLYGSDYPYAPLKVTLDQLAGSGAGEALVERMLTENAARLFPQLAG